MKNKILFVILIFLFFSLIYIKADSDEFYVTQNQIDEFLEFADDYIRLAKKYVDDEDKKTISDLFYTDSNKLFSATMKFLKNEDWAYDELNNFLYTVGVAFEAIYFYDEYGYPGSDEYLEDMDPFPDFPEHILNKVSRNRDELSYYFPKNDILDFSDDYSDYEINYDKYEDEDKKNEKKDNVRKDKNNKKIRKLLGEYNMVIDGDSHNGWGDKLIISKMQDNNISGIIRIDWGIGAEAREPMDWEIMYAYKFRTEIDDNNFKIRVIAAEGTHVEAEYNFKFIILKNKISGTVRITNTYDNSYEDYEVILKKE